MQLARGQEAADASTLTHLTQRGFVVDGRVFSTAFARYILQAHEGEMPLAPAPTVPEMPASTGLWVSVKSGDVWIDGRKLVPPLTNLEYKLLLCLYDNADCICGRYEIVEAVWSGSYIDRVDDSRIAKLVSRLRRRIEPDPKNPRYVVTVHGRGYKLATGDVRAGS
jgi:DNA-binding response OmpR family regulator